MVNVFFILVVLLLIIGLGVWYFYPFSSINPIMQQCSNQSGYCVYGNLPEGLKYVEPNEIVGEINKLGGDLSEYLDISYTSGESNYKCVLTNKDAKIIEYFYYLCEGQEEMLGCGHERRAVICDDIYFVEDFTDVYGPRFYGPFEN